MMAGTTLNRRTKGTVGFSAVAWLVVAVVCTSATAQYNVDGKWDPPIQAAPGSTPYDWPLRAMQVVHLNSERILVWHDGDDALLWNPTDGSFSPVPILATQHLIECSGYAPLEDGSILVAGGPVMLGSYIVDALATTSKFDLNQGPWVPTGDMESVRWYPTCTTLPDGRVLASGGLEGGTNAFVNDLPEVYDPTSELWTRFTTTQPSANVYPRAFVIPDDTSAATVFFAGPGRETPVYRITSLTDPLVATAECPLTETNKPAWLASQVMYEPGKVLKCGGVESSANETNDCGVVWNEEDNFWTASDYTETIDFANWVPGNNSTCPDWVYDQTAYSDMEFPRLRHNLVMLPDGHVLAIGGESVRTDLDHGYQGCPVMEAEWFDPATGYWQQLAAMSIPRAHHSTASLLKDGRVLVCGGIHYDDLTMYPATGQSAEIFSPPYLFQGQRPVIGYAPKIINYGTSFRMSTTMGTQAVDIEIVSLVRLAAVTHNFDQNQRYVPLTFVPGIGSNLSVEAPSDGSIAPPGYYMLFLVSNGVPSIAEYVQVK